MGIGRGMKVGKEEIVGLLAAVERFLKLDHAAEWRVVGDARCRDDRASRGDSRHERPARRARDCQPFAPRRDRMEPVALHVTAEEVVRRLREGDPPIAVLGEGERWLRVTVWTLRDDEHRIIANAIQQLFRGKRS